MKWEDVDLEKQFVRVNKAKVKINTYNNEGPKTQLIVKGTKSKKGNRIVPLPDEKKHGYEGFSFHKQRHSFASMLLENDEEMKTIQELLGDSTLKVVSDIYTHVAERLKKQAVNKLSGFTKIKSK